MVEQAMHQIVDYTAMAHGCTAEIEYKYLEPPVCNSDLKLNEIARNAAVAVWQGSAGYDA